MSIPRGPIPKHLERELYGTAAAKERGQPGAVRKGFGAGFGGCLGIIVAVILIFIVLIAIASQSDGAELGTHGVLYLLT